MGWQQLARPATDCSGVASRTNCSSCVFAHCSTTDFQYRRRSWRSQRSSASTLAHYASPIGRERVRSQHRFLAGRSEWPLEPSWKYGGRASKWGEAVWNALTTWWLRRLEGGEVRYVKLKIFLQWVQQQRQEQREREDRRQQQQLQGQVQDASGSSKGSDMFTVPPCVACLEARPTELCTPCHHLCLCEACPLHLMQEDDVRCPVCRSHLEGFTKAFYWLH